MRPPCGITAKTEWPADPVAVYRWRLEQIEKIKARPELRGGLAGYYRTRPVEFINHWVDTYDPRNAGRGLPTRVPFQLFQRQAEMVAFIQACRAAEAGGLIEKCRDAGATWVCCALSVHLWLFEPGAAIGWGSRKEGLVDRLGDPDSIFEKLRMIILGLPRCFWPRGFSPKDHLLFMRIINPASGATITGEAGDNIGRGGRKLIYFKDESAHYQRPETIEAALADNTRVQIDISSVNGIGNVFYRRRMAGAEWEVGGPARAGKTNVFVMDWRDHPAKTQGWYDERRQKAIDDGLVAVFAQEVDRDYAASVEGVIIPAAWVRSAIDAHVKLGIGATGPRIGALDVADGGGDGNALSIRRGIVLEYLDAWGEVDTGETTRRAAGACTDRACISLQYDCIGVGAGVKAEANRLRQAGDIPKRLKFAPWNAGARPLDPDRHVIPGDRESPLNKDFYANLKAQGWWQLRGRFERTHRAVTEPDYTYDPDDLISLPSGLPRLRALERELSQPTAARSAAMKLIVDKAPEGTPSPNLADSVMMNYWPVRSSAYDLVAAVG